MFKLVELLDQSQVRTLREIAASGQFVDGRISNPHSKVKNNLQLHDAGAYERSSKIVLDAMVQNPEFMDFTFPARIMPPLMTRYTPGMRYGLHPDAPYIPTSDGQLRTDISCTLFLAEPGEYDGGELVIEDSFGEQRVKLAAGDAILYPGTSVHRVEPVTRGARIASFFWIESMVRSAEQRRLLFNMDIALLRLSTPAPASLTPALLPTAVPLLRGLLALLRRRLERSAGSGSAPPRRRRTS